jgi:hypothetical protein
MSWNAGASRHYQGPIDRVYVSLREMHDVDFFIDEYLRQRRVELSDDNRRLVGARLAAFEGRVPYRWDDLAGFLDGDWCTGAVGVG